MRRHADDPEGQYEGDYMNFCAEEWPEYTFTQTKPPREIPELVIEDIRKRAAMGLRKFGRPLTKDTYEDWRKEIYEELMDALIYLRGEMESAVKK